MSAAGPAAAPWERADAEWALRTRTAAAGLSERERAQLAWADDAEARVQAAYTEGRFAEGEDLVRCQLEIRRLLSTDHPQYAATLVNFAAFRQAQGDIAAAEANLRDALAILTRLLGDEHPSLCEARSNLASVLRELGAHGEAERLCGEALAGWRRIHGNDHPIVAVALNNLAMIRQDQGDYAGAESPCREALAIWRRVLGESDPQVATSLGNLAMVLQRKGDCESAEALYRDALEVKRKSLGPEHAEVAIDVSNLAVVLQESRDPARRPEAEGLFRESLAMFRRLLGSEHALVATCLNNLAVLLLDMGRPEEAAAYQQEAVDISRRKLGEENRDIARAQRNLASMLRARGDLGRADDLCREAIAKQQRLIGLGHPELAQSFGELAKILWAKGDLAGSEAALVDQARVFEEARLRAGAGAERATFQKSPYNALALVRLALCKKHEAWEAAERALARVLGDALWTAPSRTEEEEKTEADLRRAFETEAREHAALATAAPQVSSSAEDAVAEACARSRARLLELERDLARVRPASPADASGAPCFELKRIQRQIPVGAAILGWVKADPDLPGTVDWGYVIRRTGPVAWAMLSSGVSRSVEEFRRRTATRPTVPEMELESARVAARESLEPMLPYLGAAGEAGAGGGVGMSNEGSSAEAPVEPQVEQAVEPPVGVRELIVIPSGSMVGAPVEAMVLEDEAAEHTLVADRFAVTYTPSSTIHARLAEAARRRGSDDRPRCLAIGDPVSLPSTPEEVRFVMGCHSPDSVALLDPGAAEWKLARMAEGGELRGFDTIHIATHAVVDDRQPERCALLFSGPGSRTEGVELADGAEELADGGDRIAAGAITAGTIARDWRLEAELVTLSACETGLGRRVPGEGCLGLASAFLRAGARSVLVSLWQVDDRPTFLLMRSFYENWFAGMSKAFALQAAKREVREWRDGRGERVYVHPFYWAGFVGLGGEG